MDLTLTSVVFEYLGLACAKAIIAHLTLTSVVFEYINNICHKYIFI